MQEYIVNALLIVVALLALVLQIIGRRPSAAMTRKQKVMLWRILAATVLLLALQTLGPAAFEPLGAAGRWVRLALFLADYLIIGYDILRKACKGIRNGQVFDENFLMAVATLGALVLAVYENGEYLEAIAVMLFYQVGEWFQSYAVGKSRRNISELMDIRPDYANIERDGRLEQVDPDEVSIGTVIVVQPGEKVPIDGTVVEGCSTLNTSALTGESLPREVRPGEEIISGCINMTGLLRIKTTKEFGESHRLQNLGPGGKRLLAQIKIRRLYLPVCQDLYSGGLLCRPGAGGRSAACEDVCAGNGGRMGNLDLPRPDVPGGQLPVRSGDLAFRCPSSPASAAPARPAFWSRAPIIWKSCPRPERWSLTRPAP